MTVVVIPSASPGANSMNFATLKSRLLTEIGRAPSELCYEMTTASINSELRIDAMTALATYPEPAANQALPGDFLEAKSIYLDVGGYRRAIPLVDVSHFDNEHLISGFPSRAAVDGSTLLVNPIEGGSLSMSYYAALDNLSADTDTNNVLANHPSIYVYGVLAHHNALKRQMQNAATYFEAMREAMREARRRDTALRTGGLSAAPLPRVAP